jgi:D-beta-D-heptose 7-phosphate kinase/D-beta-D-heptose 1-phosphate adenosyltransferase
VDRIVVYEENTPHQVLETVRPDLLVKGAVLRPDQVEGREFVESYGGRVVLLTTPAD